jgi:cytosolic carboxypeptidase protein 2/3
VLVFDSRFEGGNLRKAAKVNNVEYNLWLENDTNTRGHTQWFYFKVQYKDVPLRAEKTTHRVRFNVMNLAKTASLYADGMQPCVWSKSRHEAEGTGWFRGGDDVTYKANQIPRRYHVSDAAEGQQKVPLTDGHFREPTNAFLVTANGAGEGAARYFTLSFTYEFTAHQDDEVWFAHAVPWTYTDMNK